MADLEQLKQKYAPVVQTIQGFHQTYTVKSGDNLSKISERFYGSPNHYPKIAEASNISDPNTIRVGEQITIPVLA